MIELLGNAWLQLILWVFASGMALYFVGYMEGANLAWSYIALGILLYGLRIGYKLFPFYENTQVIRYMIGIFGMLILFMGLMVLCHSTVKRLARG